MIGRLQVALVAALAAASTGCSGVSRLDFTKFGRATWQRPDDVIEALGLDSGAQVADLGAGEGYFVEYLSEAVGPAGSVYAVEVESDLVDALRVRFAETDNVEVVLGEYTDPKLPDGAIDVVLVVNTYHHIEDREAYFRALLDDLAPGGRLVVLEPNRDLGGLLGLFVKDDHASRAENVRRELVAAGYAPVAQLDLLPIQIFEVFAPAGRTIATAGDRP